MVLSVEKSKIEDVDDTWNLLKILFYIAAWSVLKISIDCVRTTQIPLTSSSTNKDRKHTLNQTPRQIIFRVFAFIVSSILYCWYLSMSYIDEQTFKSIGTWYIKILTLWPFTKARNWEDFHEAFKFSFCHRFVKRTVNIAKTE